MRSRDEDVQSQRHVMRYLIDTTTSLREEMSRLRGRDGALGATFSAEGDKSLSPIASPGNSPSSAHSSQGVPASVTRTSFDLSPASPSRFSPRHVSQRKAASIEDGEELFAEHAARPLANLLDRMPQKGVVADGGAGPSATAAAGGAAAAQAGCRRSERVELDTLKPAG